MIKKNKPNDLNELIKKLDELHPKPDEPFYNIINGFKIVCKEIKEINDWIDLQIEKED